MIEIPIVTIFVAITNLKLPRLSIFQDNYRELFCAWEI